MGRPKGSKNKPKVISVTKPTMVLMTVVLDETGSMMPLRDETIVGFNNYIETQKQVPGEMRVNLMQFNSAKGPHYVYRDTPVKDVPKLTSETYRPDAWTPLLDSVGKAIVESEAAEAKYRDAYIVNHLIVVLTDGEENSSKEFTKVTLQALVKAKEITKTWQFAFSGQGIDAWHAGRGIGMAGVGTTRSFDHSAVGTRSAYDALGQATANYRVFTGARGQSLSSAGQNFFDPNTAGGGGAPTQPAQSSFDPAQYPTWEDLIEQQKKNTA